ncbi:Palmitoyl-protein thioesterase 1 [Aphelenchoides besseyi]|nr:Palmitoyl-protein thioesterase 1 [Aphelenchoides besseyi]
MSDNPIIHPSLPFAADIPNGLFAGRSILVRGTVRESDYKRFNIDLCCGRLINGDHRDDVALHFNPRFEKGSWLKKAENVIVFNSLQNNKWGMEHRVPNSLQVESSFTLRILVLQDYYKITLNGKHCVDFIHRIPIDNVRCIYIDGSLSVEQLEYQGDPKPQSPIDANNQQNSEFVPVDVFKPTTPFVHSIGRSGFVPDRQLKIVGTPRMSATRFEINFLAGSEHLFHFRVDLPTSTIPAVKVDGLPFVIFRWRDIKPQMANSLNVRGDLILQTPNGGFRGLRLPVDRVDCRFYSSGHLVRNLMLGSNIFSDGYHALGFSQGGLFVRALAQRCTNPPVKGIVSIGGPQFGIYGFPYCLGDEGICDTVRRMLNIGAYVSFIQDNLVQAQYWHDPFQLDDYKDKSIFLADINCERSCNQTQYKANLLRLKYLALVQFTKDEMVVPKESEWFGFFPENNATHVVPMNQTDFYKKDVLGLKTLNESGRLHLLSVDGNHLQIGEQYFIDKIVKQYFMN